MSTPPVPRSPNPTAPGSTRQMLDELDALMQRMLALPVNQIDDEPATEDRGRRIEDRQERSEEAALKSPDRKAEPSLPEDAAAPVLAPRPAPLAPLPPIRDPRPAEQGARPAPKLIAHPPAPFPPLPHRVEVPERPARAKLPVPDEPAAIIPPVETPAPALAPPVPAPLPPPPPVRAAPSRPAPAPRLSPRPYLAPPRTPPPAPVARIPEWVMRPLLWSNRTFDRWTGWLGAAGRRLRGPKGRMALGWVGLGLWAVTLTLLVLRFLR